MTRTSYPALQSQTDGFTVVSLRLIRTCLGIALSLEMIVLLIVAPIFMFIFPLFSFILKVSSWDLLCARCDCSGGILLAPRVAAMVVRSKP